MRGLRPRRRGTVRDARIIALALEGEETGEEHEYFSALKNLLHQSRCEIHLIPTPADRHLSSPDRVLDRMIQFEREHVLEHPFDKAWLVFDRDTSERVGPVTNEGSRRNYGIAASNPCFELWLLLHHEDADAGSFRFDDTEARDKCRLLKRRIGEIRANGKLHTSNLSVEAIEAAVHRAQALLSDEDHAQRFPPCPGTFIYRIIQDLKDLQLFPEQEALQPPTGHGQIAKTDTP